MQEIIDHTGVRGWLAAALMGRAPAWPFAPDAGVDTVVEVAEAEGITALLQAQVRASATTVPDTLHQTLDAAVPTKAAQSLFRQVQCRAILARLEEADLPALVLKGSALAYWAYDEPYLRDSGDVDLLLPSRAHVERAVEAIAPLGYALSDRIHPGDLARFESTCVHTEGGDRLEIDLHWHLSNVPLFAFRFGWEELRAQSMALPLLVPGARGLSPALALVHACTHRTKHLATGEDCMKWLYDLVVLARRFDPEDWHTVQEQSARHGLAGVCLMNLQHAEAQFGAFVPAEVLATLAAASRSEPWRAARLQSWWYFQIMNWKAFPTRRMRWRWLRQHLLPGAAFLRNRYATRSVTVALWRRMLTGVRRLGR